MVFEDLAIFNDLTSRLQRNGTRDACNFLSSCASNKHCSSCNLKAAWRWIFKSVSPQMHASMGQRQMGKNGEWWASPGSLPVKRAGLSLTIYRDSACNAISGNTLRLLLS